MRQWTLVALILASILVPVRAGEDAGGEPALEAENATALLRTFVKHQRAGDAEAAWASVDAAILAQRAFGARLANEDLQTRTLVIDLLGRGLRAMSAREPLRWTAKEVTIYDYQATPRGEGAEHVVQVTFRWKSAGNEPLRWGVLVARGETGLAIVDLVFGPLGELSTCSGVLSDEYARWGKKVGGLPRWLRTYFRLPLPGMAVPVDAPVDWASPDVLALDLVEPTVAGASPDGWFAAPVQPSGGTLLYRDVVHVLADGTMRWRDDALRWGGVAPLDRGSLLGEEGKATLKTFRPRAPLLIRADHRTPWAAVRALLVGVPAWNRPLVAFAVRRTEEDGPPLQGQVGITAQGEVSVAASREALEAREGFPRPVPAASPRGAAMTVRVESRTPADGARSTWIQVGDAEATRLPRTGSGPDRRAALRAVQVAVARNFLKRRRGHVRLDVSKGTAHDVPLGDVVQILAALRAVPSATVEFALPDDTARLARPLGRPKVTYTLPEGWVLRPARIMREVTAAPSEGGEAECVVSVLPGTAGGWKNNIRRWYAQMGAETPTDAILDALPRWPVCGGEAYVVTIKGTVRLRTGDAAPDALMYGVVCPLENATVFVKMVGPRAEVEGEHERFRAFCTSLRLKEGDG